MTGETVATAHWRALDREGEDKCRLARMGGGWMLVGHARFRDAQGPAALDYVIRCDAGCYTLTCDVSGTHGGADIALRLERGSDGWLVNDVPRPDLHEAVDVELAFSPATYLMPIRRLPEVGAIDICSAWLRLPGPKVDPLNQTFRRERGGFVHYAAQETGVSTHIAVDDNGFVTDYPGRWEAVP